MMIILPVLLLLPTATQPLPTLNEVQFSECLTLARTDPASAVTDASQWAQQGGGYLARACQGFALARDFKFDLALPVLTEAAKGADEKGDARATRFWAQAANAAIVAGAPQLALDALTQALNSENLSPQERADGEVDRARALVALNQTDNAEKALATARKLSPENGTAWLLSATLSRRLGKLPDALAYIQTAAALSPRDAAVALEAGNIAIAAGDEAAARKQWQQAIAIAPDSRQAISAKGQIAALTGNLAPTADPQSR